MPDSLRGAVSPGQFEASIVATGGGRGDRMARAEGSPSIIEHSIRIRCAA